MASIFLIGGMFLIVMTIIIVVLVRLPERSPRLYNVIFWLVGLGIILMVVLIWIIASNP